MRQHLHVLPFGRLQHLNSGVHRTIQTDGRPATNAIHALIVHNCRRQTTIVRNSLMELGLHCTNHHHGQSHHQAPLGRISLHFWFTLQLISLNDLDILTLEANPLRLLWKTTSSGGEMVLRPGELCELWLWVIGFQSRKIFSIVFWGFLRIFEEILVFQMKRNERKSLIKGDMINKFKKDEVSRISRFARQKSFVPQHRIDSPQTKNLWNIWIFLQIFLKILKWFHF